MTTILPNSHTIVAPAEAYKLTAPPGTRVKVSQIALKSLDATVVEMAQSAVARLRGRRISARLSAFGAVAARHLEISTSFVGAQAAWRVQAGTIVAQWLFTGSVTATRVIALAVIAPRVQGSVTTLLDARGAVALGVAMGLTSTIVRAVRRWIRRRTA